MVEIKFEYQGDLRCEALHAPSGTTLNTDAPKDNQGKGESFSPTDLVATALGSCILTTMAIRARKFEVEIKGATAQVSKIMSKDAPRRIIGLPVRVVMPQSFSNEINAQLEDAANNCPVKLSIDSDIDAPIEFVWGESR